MNSSLESLLEIWIVDDDLEFHHHFKYKLKIELSKRFSQKIEIKSFYDFNQYETHLLKLISSKEYPLFIFFDPNFRNENKISHYIDLIKSHKEMFDKFCLVSSQAFGHIDNYLNQHRVKVTNFLHKLRLHYDLKDTLKNIDETLSNIKPQAKLKLKTFKQKRSLKEIQKILEQIEVFFYEKFDKNEVINLLRDLEQHLTVLEIEYNSSMKKIAQYLTKRTSPSELKLKGLVHEVVEWLKNLGVQ